MAEVRPNAAPTAAEEDGPLVLNLQILSPSAGVPSMRFADLPAATTVRQLKEKIRESLPSRPADNQQRLIYRGRPLIRDSDTLQDIIGEQTIRTSEQQTIHLVLPETGDVAPSSDPVPRPDGHIHHHNGRHTVRNVSNTTLSQPGLAPIRAPQAAAHPPQHAHPHQHPHPHPHHLQHQDLIQRIRQLQQREEALREAWIQQRRAERQHEQQQRQQNNTAPVSITVDEYIITPVAAPRPMGGSGPTSDPVGSRPLSAAEVRNIIHGADAARAAQTMASAMQRNAASVPVANTAADLANFNFNMPIQPIQPGVTAPIVAGLSRNASQVPTPDSSGRSVSHGSGVESSNPQSQAQPQRHAEVYILSSPTGPRGLLINHTSEIYTSPGAHPLTWMPNPYRTLVSSSVPPGTHRPDVQIHHGLGHGQVTITGPGQPPVHIPFPHTHPYQPPHLSVPQQPLAQPHVEQPAGIRRRPVAGPAAPPAPAAPAAAQAAPRMNHPGNPGAGALVAAVWPHIWLIIRLIAFTWWFSYTNPSWERWLSLAFAAFIVFAINTGIFNGMVNQAFHPVREQLEGMIPFEDPDRQQQQQQQPQQQPQEPHHDQGEVLNQNGSDGVDPDPAQAAARLVAQRRLRNGHWLRNQVRRIERASILFLASFAPGVAERHIQQLEERERAERRAAEEARAAAAAAQQQAEAETAQTTEENQAAQEGQRGEVSNRAGEQQQAQPQPPLVEV